jgi:hypothetical protein
MIHRRFLSDLVPGTSVRRSWIVCTSLVVLLAATPGAASQDLPKIKGEPMPAAELGRLRDLLTIVQHAERVEAPPIRQEGEGLSASFHIIEKPVLLDSATGRSVRRLLAGYDWPSGSAMACVFQPSIAFRFRRGNDATVVLVCFFCGEMALDGVHGSLGDKRWLAPKEHETLLRAAKKAFPKEFDGFDR